MPSILAAATIVAAVGIGVLTTAARADTLLQTKPPPVTNTLFNAIGTFNFGNQKARLEAAGQATVQGGNPGNGWWGDGTPTTTGNTPVRSWKVIWDATTGTVQFDVFASSDWSGTAAMSMSQVPTLAPGNIFVGLNIGARLSSTTQSVTLDDIQFSSNGGPLVPIPTAEGTYSGNVFIPNYHGFDTTGAAVDDFELRGTTLFPTGTTTGDSMRFFVQGLQASSADVLVNSQGGPIVGGAVATPEPASMALFGAGLAALGLLRRRSRRDI